MDRAGAIFSAEGTPEASLFESADTTAGNTFANSVGKVLAIIWNTHATNAITATFVTTKTVDGYAVADQAVAVAAETWKIVGAFTSNFQDSGKLITVNWTGTGTGNIMIVKMTA